MVHKMNAFPFSQNCKLFFLAFSNWQSPWGAPFIESGWNWYHAGTVAFWVLFLILSANMSDVPGQRQCFTYSCDFSCSHCLCFVSFAVLHKPLWQQFSVPSQQWHHETGSVSHKEKCSSRKGQWCGQPGFYLDQPGQCWPLHVIVSSSSLHWSFSSFLCCFSPAGVFSDYTSSLYLCHRYLFCTFQKERGPTTYKLRLSHCTGQVKQ